MLCRIFLSLILLHRCGSSLGWHPFYRRFISHFAKIVSPLHNLLNKEAEFVWTEECQAAFDSRKHKLVEAPVLAYTKFECSCILETDASIKGLGAVRSQRGDDGRSHPIAYASRALAAPEKNYGISELETLTVVWTIQHFHACLCGHDVTVVTDHSAVSAILEVPSPSGKHGRWWLKVFASGVGKVHLEYREGWENAKADVLSHNPVSSESGEPVELDVQVAHVRLQDMELPELLMAPPVHGVVNEFYLEQQKDPELRNMYDFLEAGTLPSSEQDAKETAAQAPSFTLIDKVLYFVDLKGDGRKCAAVPAHLRERILTENHAGLMAGHFSGNRLYCTLS